MDMKFYLAWICIIHLSIFAIILLRKKTNKPANRVLAWFMLNFAIIHSTNLLVFSGLVIKYHYINEYCILTVFFQGPLYLWFVSLMTGIKINWKKYFYLHALPFVFGIIWAISCTFKTNIEIK